MTGPELYLSSAGAGWTGVTAEAFHEPPRLEGWMTTPLPLTSLILVRGGGLRMVGGGAPAVDLGHGDGILRPPEGPRHEVGWTALSAAPTQTLHLHIDESLLPRCRRLVGRPRLRDPLVTEIGFALWRELEEGSPGGRLYAQSAAHLLAAHLQRHHAPGTPSSDGGPGLTPRQLRRVTEFVMAHLDEDVSLEAMAAQADLSAAHFARQFTRAVGESPYRFVVRQRVELARRLLAGPDVPLVQVAFESGFANQSHLTRTFKRHLGVTPGAYRRTIVQ